MGGTDRGGFTLVELMVVIAIVALLASLAAPALNRAGAAARGAQCMGRMRSLGLAVILCAQDRDGEFPRSSHSAYGHREPSWAKSILPYLDGPAAPTTAQWEEAQKRHFRCPEDRERTRGLSYGLNVYFELDPGFDDYAGSPATWRRLASVARPSATVMLAELKTATSADHVMAHFWEGTGEGAEVDGTRHGGRSNYVFVDGHAARLALRETFDPGTGLDLWNPGTAGER